MSEVEDSICIIYVVLFGQDTPLAEQPTEAEMADWTDAQPTELPCEKTSLESPEDTKKEMPGEKTSLESPKDTKKTEMPGEKTSFETQKTQRRQRCLVRRHLRAQKTERIAIRTTDLASQRKRSARLQCRPLPSLRFFPQ